MSADPTARRYGYQQQIDTHANPLAVGLALESTLREVARAVRAQTEAGAVIDLETFQISVEPARHASPVLAGICAVRTEWTQTGPDG